MMQMKLEGWMRNTELSASNGHEMRCAAEAPGWHWHDIVWRWLVRSWINTLILDKPLLAVSSDSNHLALSS